MLDLVFSTERSECGLMVTDLVSVPLSWSDHHLIKCNLSPPAPQGARPYFNDLPLRATGSITIPGYHEIPADLAGVPVEALMAQWLNCCTTAKTVLTTRGSIPGRAGSRFTQPSILPWSVK